jgi:acyl-CoA synthetase (AMP-forming)/AMP-acid ligase II
MDQLSIPGERARSAFFRFRGRSDRCSALQMTGKTTCGDRSERGSQRERRRVTSRAIETFAKWQLPDGFVFVSELPHTSTGKLQKSELRHRFRD